PPLPKPNSDGTVNAVDYARASIAREIITRRQAAGMTQTELAKAAGVRVETLNRIENARHTADVATIAKLDAALPKPPAESGSPSGGKRKAFGIVDAPSRGTSKLMLVNTGTDKRFVRRGTKGQFKESDDVGRSLYGSKAGRGTSKR